MKKLHNIVIRHTLSIAALLLAVIGVSSCEIFGQEHTNSQKRVFIIYSAGFNNLASYLNEDINEICEDYASVKGNNHVVIFSHRTKTAGNYSTPNSPVIVHLRKDKEGKVCRDTLMVMDPSTISASSETLTEALTFIKEEFQEAEYSILFSSHGTGWAPQNYCNKPDEFENTAGGTPSTDNELESTFRIKARENRQPSWGVVPEDGGPVVKSFGVQNIDKYSYHEMDITDMANAFPMKMKTIIFDACFMGGVEVAYELRNVADYIIASQTEILADGMDYNTMLSYVFGGGGIFSSVNKMSDYCENFYNYYNNQSYVKYRSATISLTDCSRLEGLADVCKTLFSKYRDEIAALEGSMSVQRYYRIEHANEHRWFYDLEDILLHCNITDKEKETLSSALADCVIYKAATERFISDIYMTNHSGLSMYLPYKDRKYLNDFYKTLSWNKATGLIE